MIKNDAIKYGLLSKSLHWLIAGVMIFLIWLGWYMTGLTYYDPNYYQFIELHKSLGMAILMLLGLKLAWALLSPLPKLDGGLNKWEYGAAWFTHKILWMMIIFLPLTGYLISTSADAPISFFALFDFPAVMSVSNDLRDMSITAHYYLAYVGAVFVVVHLLAALKHHFINKDDTLRRIL